MRERMHELCGKLEIESDRSGTLMRAVVPLFAMVGSSLDAGSASEEALGM
jgi:signal transduction histidine kinase